MRRVARSLSSDTQKQKATDMKRIAPALTLFLTLLLLGIVTAPAQDKPATQQYEYAMIQMGRPGSHPVYPAGQV
jgi:hypothetical protein